MKEDEKIVSVAYVSALTGLSRSTVYRYASTGEIPCMKFLGAIRFRKEDVDNFVKKSVISGKEVT